MSELKNGVMLTENALRCVAQDIELYYKIADDTFRHWENAAYAMRDDERKRHRWIPISERLPERDERVLAYSQVMADSEAGVQIAKGFTMHNKRSAFTHWMPLPAPPEEGENEA